jgi:hypothetical protein
MKIIKYIGAGICMLIAAAQTVPIYLITSGLIQGQGEDNTSYFVGKLIGHIFVTILVILIASIIIKNVINQGRTNREKEDRSNFL